MINIALHATWNERNIRVITRQLERDDHSIWTDTLQCLFRWLFTTILFWYIAWIYTHVYFITHFALVFSLGLINLHATSPSSYRLIFLDTITAYYVAPLASRGMRLRRTCLKRNVLTAQIDSEDILLWSV